MLKSLDELRMGLITPKAFTSEAKLRRTLDITIANYITVPPVDAFGATSLDIEQIDNRYLLYGGKNGTVAIYDLGGTSKYPYNVGVVARIRPSPDTHQFSIAKVQWYPFDTGLFTTSSKCKSLKIWDTNTSKPVDTIRFGFVVNCHDMSRIASQNKLIAVATDSPNISLYDVKNGLATHELKGHERGVQSVAWSPMDSYLLASGGTDRRIIFWDVRSARSFLKVLDWEMLVGKRKSIFLDDYSSRNEKLRFQGSNLPIAHDAPIKYLKFTDNGLQLVSRCSQHNVYLWDVAIAKRYLVNYGLPLEKPDRNWPIHFDIFSDSKLPVLFNPCSKNIIIQDLFTGTDHAILKGHCNFVNCCVYRSSTQELYSAAHDMNIIAWAPAETVKNVNMEKKFLNQLENGPDDWSDTD